MISREAAERILREIGCAPEGEGSLGTCPVCRSAPLNISQNGNGPHFDCADGCDGIGAFLLGVASAPGADSSEEPDVPALLTLLRKRLALPELVEIVKHGRHGNSYILHLTGGRTVSIAGVTALLSQVRFRSAYLPQVRRNLPRFKAAGWDEIVEAIEQVAQERDAVATPEDETRGWLAGHLAHATVMREVDTGSAARMFSLLGKRGSPPPFFDREGRLHVRLEPVVEYLGRFGGARVTTPELSTRLSQLGFDGRRLAARQGEEVRRARYWVSSPGFEDTLR